MAEEKALYDKKKDAVSDALYDLPKDAGYCHEKEETRAKGRFKNKTLQ